MNAQKDISARAWLEMLLLAAIWGGIFLATRLALNEVGVLTSVAHRTFWAALILWAVVAILGLRVPRDAGFFSACLIMGIVNNAIPFSLLNWSQLHIESGLASILNGSTAIFGVLVAALVFSDERLTARKLIGVSVGFLGVATAIGLQNLLNFNLRSIAQLAVLGGALSYALAGAWARKKLGHLPAQVSAAGMLTASALITVPAAWVIDGPFIFALAPVTIGALTYMSVIGTALAFLLYYRVLSMAGSGNLMLVTLLIPPFAILLGALFLGELLHPRALAGFGFLAVGLLILDGRIERRLRGRSGANKV